MNQNPHTKAAVTTSNNVYYYVIACCWMIHLKVDPKHRENSLYI